MFARSYVVGSSFSRGDGLHYYDRFLNHIAGTHPITPTERFFNYKNSYPFLLNKMLGISWPFIFNGYRNNVTMMEEIDDLVEEITKETMNDTIEKICNATFLETNHIIVQLSSPQRLFHYDGIFYQIDLQDEEGFAKSLDSILKNKSSKFIKGFQNEVQFFFKKTDEWEIKNCKIVFDRIQSFLQKMNDLEKTVKIISYYKGFEEYSQMFLDNSYVTIKYKDKEYFNIREFVDTEKLKISDTFGINDDHPNLYAHEIVAKSLYDSLMDKSKNILSKKYI